MMMLLPHPEAQQDSVPVQNITRRDSVRLKSDSVSAYNPHASADTLPHRIKILPVSHVNEITDTISVCSRNSIEDATFYDSTGIMYRIEPARPENFPYLFIEKNRIIANARKAELVKHLRQGSEIPLQPLHSDWILLILLTVTLLFTLIRKSSVNILKGAGRFFLFKGVNDSSFKDPGGILSWESTIKNLISFIILGLFGYFAAAYYNIIPSHLTGILFWIISVAIIIGAVTLRHFVCLLAGIASDERDLFNEYMLGIYQFYRFSSLFIFIISVVLTYTTLFHAKSCFSAAIIIISILYLIRVIRLLLLFINRKISLFYFILYLCALEILPVAITVKYISGFV